MKKYLRQFRKRLRKWSTRKTTLWFAVSAVLCYTLADCILTIINANTGTAIYFDSTLTTEFFSFFKWLVGLGGGITVAGIVKGNSDEGGMG